MDTFYPFIYQKNNKEKKKENNLQIYAEIDLNIYKDNISEENKEESVIIIDIL